MAPLISVLIPAYNVESYLSQCLESIVNQTYKNFHVVVVDDGSVDNTYGVAKEYAERYPSVEVIHQDNLGVSSARNVLLSYAKGDFVIFVDSDDWIEPDMLERMLNKIHDTGADIAVCGNVKEFPGQTLYAPVVDQERMVEGQEEVVKTLIFHKELNGSLCNKLVPRKYYEGLTFRKDIWYGEDCLFFWQAINRGVKRICFMSECMYHYRMNEQSISHEPFNYKKMTGHEVWKQINNDVEERWPQLKDLGNAAYAVSDMWLLYYATKARYKKDDNILTYQKNVRNNLWKIYKSGLISIKKVVFAVLIAYSYTFGGFVNRYIG